MANVSVTTGEQVDQLIEDTRKMVRELAQIARSDRDPARRQQAQRWLDTIIKFAEYALRCRDNARRGR
jgi:hypothetical protein